jgi:CheY-like chemotaxis protein
MLHILLVDDAQEDLGFFERALRQCKILNQVTLLHSGEECIAYLQANQTPDLSARFIVFLDLMMGSVGGIAVLRRLKSLGIAEDSIFVMVSGITDIKALNEGYQLGARTFIIKPVKPDDLMETLQALKSKINVEKKEEGYVLEWDVSSKPNTPQASDTSLLKRGVSLSA